MQIIDLNYFATIGLLICIVYTTLMGLYAYLLCKKINLIVKLENFITNL